MRRALSSAFAVLLCIAVTAQERNFWTGVSESRITKDLFANRFKPAAYKIFQLDEPAMTAALRSVPSEKNVSAAASDFIITIPNENGQLERFRVVEAPVMHPLLAAKYPGINSYAGQGIDDPSATIRFDVSPAGFHGMILSSTRKTIYID